MKIWRWTKEIIVQSESETGAQGQVMDELLNGAFSAYSGELEVDEAAQEMLLDGELKQLWPVPSEGEE